MHLRRQLGQKTREMRLHRRRQLVHVIDNEHVAAAITAEVRENPIHHRASVAVVMPAPSRTWTELRKMRRPPGKFRAWSADVRA